MSTRPSDASASILDVLRDRWSPRVFDERPVEEEKIRAVLEAARWAPSSYNEQPWRFILARKSEPDRHERVLDCINEKNRKWARRAPVLMVALASTRFSRNGRRNRHAWYDVGQAVAHLSVQATALDLYLHQMAGFSSERVRERFDVPEEIAPVAAIALGYRGDPEDPPHEVTERDPAGRSRKPLDELLWR